MASTQERLTKLIDDNVMIEGRSAGDALNLDRSIADSGVPSPQIVALWQLVNEEFGVEISAEQFADLLTPRDLIAHLDGLAG